MLVVVTMAVLGGVGARLLARRLLAAGPNLVEDRLAVTRGLTFVLATSLILLTPLVVLVATGLFSVFDNPLFFFSPWTGLATLVITPAVLAGYFPIRRGVFGDTWSCAAYVSWVLRFALIVGGPWVFLFLGPSMTHLAGPGRFITASGLAVGLALWAWQFGASANWMLDARDDVDDVERASLREIAHRAGVPDLCLRSTAPDEAAWVTVLPLPISRPPIVFASRAFLERLGPRGRRGVFAREAARIAHIRKHSWLAHGIPLLVVGASLVEPVLALIDPGTAAAYRWLWVGGFVFVPLIVGTRQAKLELDLDRRAMVLLGNDRDARETMEETLRSIAGIARWSNAATVGAVPGTLSMRLAALAEGDASDDTPPAPLAPMVFQSQADPHTWLAIDDNGVHQLMGVDTSDAASSPDLDWLRARAHQVLRLSFEDLTYLAVTPKRGSMGVLAISGAGATIHIPVAPDDEVRAGEAVAAAAPRVRNPLIGMAAPGLGGLIFFGAISSFYLSFGGWVPGGAVLLLLLTSVCALLLWRRPTIAALGAMTTAAGVAATAQIPGHDVSMVDGLCIALLLGSGLGALAMSLRAPREGEGRFPDGGAWMTGVVLLIASLPAISGLLSAAAVGDGALYLSGLARGSGGVVFAWVGAGAAFVVHPGSARRTLAAVLLVAGAAIGVARTDGWLETVARDPLASGERFSKTERSLPAASATFSVTGDGWDLRITPDGRTVVYGTDVEGGHGDGPIHLHRYTLHPTDTPAGATAIDAYALALGADGRAIALTDAGSGTALEIRSFDVTKPDRVLTSIPIDATLPGEPHLQIVGDEFVLIAASDERRYVAIGPLDGDAAQIRARTEGVIRGVWPTFDGSHGFLEVESSAEKRGPRLSLERMLWIVRPPVDLRTIAWWSDGSERHLSTASAIAPWCELGAGGSTEILCVGETHDTRWLWRVKDGRELTPLGRMDAFGWWRFTGERVVALAETDLVVGDPGGPGRAGRETRYPLPGGTSHDLRFDAAGSAVVLGTPTASGLRIDVYRDIAP